MHRILDLTGPLPQDSGIFPDSLRCLVTLTNDGEFRNENDFEPQFRDVDSLQGKMTLYVMETEKVSRNWTENGQREDLRFQDTRIIRPKQLIQNGIM
jgi:hypothetical protein